MNTTKKYFYAVAFKSGRKTTFGQPNKQTGRHSLAVDCKAFTTKKDRDAWVAAGETTADMGGNCREAVTRIEIHQMHMGLDFYEVNDLIDNLHFQAEHNI